MQAISHPNLQRLYEYWLARRGGRSMPSRGDLDALDMTFVIGNIILVDVIAGSPPGFRIRLHGTNLVERAGYELTGKMLDELPQTEFRDLARRSFTKVVNTAQPLHAANDRIIDGKVRHYETVMLPLSDDGVAVDRLLIGLIYADGKS